MGLKVFYIGNDPRNRWFFDFSGKKLTGKGLKRLIILQKMFSRLELSQASCDSNSCSFCLRFSDFCFVSRKRSDTGFFDCFCKQTSCGMRIGDGFRPTTIRRVSRAKNWAKIGTAQRCRLDTKHKCRWRHWARAGKTSFLRKKLLYKLHFLLII